MSWDSLSRFKIAALKARTSDTAVNITNTQDSGEGNISCNLITIKGESLSVVGMPICCRQVKDLSVHGVQEGPALRNSHVESDCQHAAHAPLSYKTSPQSPQA